MEESRVKFRGIDSKLRKEAYGSTVRKRPCNIKARQVEESKAKSSVVIKLRGL